MGIHPYIIVPSTSCRIRVYLRPAFDRIRDTTSSRKPAAMTLEGPWINLIVLYSAANRQLNSGPRVFERVVPLRPIGDSGGWSPSNKILL